MAVGTLPLGGCAGDSETRVIIAGSTSVQPYAEILAEDFLNLRPDIEVDIQGGGSSAGITAVQTGAAEIGMSSRSLKDEESDLWVIEIAKDGLAVIVNPANPVGDLSLEQIRDIYTTEISNWSELGGPDAKIHIITREDGSGTRSAFEELVMGTGYQISPRAIVQDSNGAVRQLVADDPYAIGFISLGLVNVGEKPVKPLSLDGVVASHDNVQNGSYGLSRPFLFVARQEPEGAAKEFIDFIMSDEGRRILGNEGLVVQ
ncbi:MAG: phosphate ABC transporter substrate-binding protein [Coriobacteriia bacterium]|nr:phosphate ABC transporter substrate-binding protein [Coriobacteriia bacterium]